MNARDNQAWEAMRLIGDAVAHTKSGDPKAIHDDLLSPSFTLGAFKGQGLTVRDWNQQLRQPILLTDGRATVSVSPQEGFLHRTSELDTPASTGRRRNANFSETRDPLSHRPEFIRKPRALSGSAHATTAYITNEKGNSISVIDLDKLEVIHTIKTGQRPRGIALSKDDSQMFVCLGDDDTIAVIDTKTLKEVGEMPSGPDPEQLRVSPDGKLLFSPTKTMRF